MTTPHFPEVPGDIPDPLTPREHAIRAIHGYADWLTRHPEVPAPTYVHGMVYAKADSGPDEAQRMAPVLAFAEQHDARVIESAHAVSSVVIVLQREGIMVDHTYGAYKDSNTYTGKADGQ